MDPLSTRLALGAAGAAGGAAAGLGVEDVFSTFLYAGDGTTSRTITNGIDFSGEGGLLWLKSRTSAHQPWLFDTERGAGKPLASDTTQVEQNNIYHDTFNSDGFSLDSGNNNVNGSGNNYTSWSFRKAPGFFDVVTYSGNGSTQTISHNLGTVPGCIIIKARDGARNWAVYHRDRGNGKALKLDDYVAERAFAGWDYTTPTASEFYLGADSDVNNAAYTYVAYLFAHDEAVFGENADQSIIKCGSYVAGAYPSSATVNLGWEPQWVMIKLANQTLTTGDWMIFDNMRGVATVGDSNALEANTDVIESSGYDYIDFTSTGFLVDRTQQGWGAVNNPGKTYIYIAIRRGPMKTPTDATEVFDVINRYGSSSIIEIEPDITADLAITLRREGNAMYTLDRLRGDKDFYMEGTNAESSSANEAKLVGNSTNSAYKLYNETDVNNSFYEYINWFFKRAPGFFDVVAYTGTGSATTVSHNLGVAPDLFIVKARSTTSNWHVYSSADGYAYYYRLNTDDQRITQPGLPLWNNTNPTSTVFSLGSNLNVNGSGTTYIAYLFASLPGICKIGKYTGTGSNLNVDCGFSAGARFVLIKRTDSGNTHWYIWDTERGITAGNDPYSRIGFAETTTTDYIDPLNAGFTVTSSAPAALNALGGDYLFLAIA